MSILEVHDVSIRYMTGDFKDIGLKEYVVRKIKDDYRVNEFWADKNISFTLEKGDMLGIIGTNGAGKSTLLKAVSGIMEPTGGYVRREGNIAALLELASGFDGDLTVRENAYLRGAMLGYTRRFMDEKYDEIIDFAELQDFQDRPFKQLSSGMKSRLAFSIASLVAPDILILDEVLSVGDGAFRKKSEEKMREIIASGATTILVSHSIEQVRELCNKVLWIEKGKQVAFGDTETLCNLYQQYLNHVITLEQAKGILQQDRTAEKPKNLDDVDVPAEEPQNQNRTVLSKGNKKLNSIAAPKKEPEKEDKNTLYHKEGSKGMFLLGVFLLSLFFFDLAVTTLLFAFGIQMSSLNLVAAILCSTGVCFFLSRYSVKDTATVLLLGVVILCAAALISGHVFDGSWDGNRYHKSITGALKWGWNPLQETFYDFAKDIPFLADITETWYDAYPKGTEIWAASIYVLTNQIEMGKCFNLLAMVALFCISYAFLVETKRFWKAQIVAAALFCVVNPVTLSQITTYYVDGFLWQLFLACMIALLYLTFFENGRYQIDCLYLIFISINLGFSVKFSALLYFGVLCICFLGYWVVKKCQESGWKENKGWIWRRFWLFAAAVISGTAFVGSTSYGINLLRHKNPVYTLIGDGSTEIIISQLPNVYKDMARPVQFIASLFSKTSNNKALDHIEWKFPFTYGAAEITAAQGYDTRIAAWGHLFSGILLISFFVLLIAVIKLKKESNRKKKAASLTILFAIIYIISICLIPGMCWARYNGVLFYIPVGALLYLFAIIHRRERGAICASFLAGTLMITLFLNVIPNIGRVRQEFKEYNTVKNQLTQFKELAGNSTEPVTVGHSGEYRFEGRFFTLYDMGITNFEYGNVAPEDRMGTLFNNGRELCYGTSQGKALAELFGTLHTARGKLILFAIKDEGSKALTAEFIMEMRSLGLDFNLEGAYRTSYVAALMDGKVLTERKSEEKLTCQAQAAGALVELTSGGHDNGNIASIKINGVEYAKNKRGLNVVIYDPEKGTVVESLSIDTYLDNRIYR